MTFLAALMFVLGAGCEGTLAFLFLRQQPLAAMGICHLLGVFFLGLSYSIYCSRAAAEKWTASKYFFAYLCAVLFPFLGLLAAFLYYRSIRPKVFEEEEEEKVWSSDAVLNRMNAFLDEETLPHILRRVRSEISFQPIIDIMKGREMKAKARAIRLLSRTISKENVNLLREALKDPIPEVRLYAAGALLKIESDLNRQIQKAREQSEQRGSEKDFAVLAELYRNYAQIGITDEALAHYYLELAVVAYQHSLDLHTGQPEVTMGYADCLLALKQYDRARLLMDHAVQIWPQNKDIVFLRNGLYFDLGRCKEIGAFFSPIAGQKLNEIQQKACEFWTQEQ